MSTLNSINDLRALAESAPVVVHEYDVTVDLDSVSNGDSYISMHDVSTIRGILSALPYVPSAGTLSLLVQTSACCGHAFVSVIETDADGMQNSICCGYPDYVQGWCDAFRIAWARYSRVMRAHNLA